MLKLVKVCRDQKDLHFIEKESKNLKENLLWVINSNSGVQKVTEKAKVNDQRGNSLKIAKHRSQK